MSRWRTSLRWRLLGVALVAVTAALAIAGWWIARLFEQHVTQQFDQRLDDQLTQVIALLTVEATGRPALEGRLPDPRWERPYSGLYWQVQALAGDAEPVLRSRSLWDERLTLPADVLDERTVHRHVLPGPAGQTLRVLERTVYFEGRGPHWRVAVGADRRALDAATLAFRGALAWGLVGLGGVLLLAVAVQVELGLRPLQALRAAVERVRRGEQDCLQGTFPREVVPLVEDFNRLLAHDAQVVERARRMAGNLAHAVKTPLAVMTALAEDAQLSATALRYQLLEQIGAMRQQIDWQLRRARAAAAGTARRTPVVPVVQGLLRLMEKVHAVREGRSPLTLSLRAPPGGTPTFAGEAEDLREMVGNLLDNACKWAATRVQVDIGVADGRLCIQVEDDGPGLSVEQCRQVLQRGVRADERVPGAGLGLDIVREVAALYGADLRLERGAWGGLCARLSLPLG